MAQVDSLIGQMTNSFEESFAGGVSGDGRFVVIESRGNLATVNPRNEDGNVEIFLFDYAQRQIFQITDTKSVRINPNLSPLQSNIRVEITNRRPVISHNGRWIAFGSNATRSVVVSPSPAPVPPDGTNPGNFDGNAFNTQDPPPAGCTVPTPSPTPTPTATPSPTATPTPGGTPSPTPTPAPTPFNNPLDCDANLEMWLYEIPAAPPADLTTGEEIPFVDLSTGAFTQLTNTPASRLPQPAGIFTGAFVANDNHDASIDDDGETLAFVSTRDLVAGRNSFPTNDNDEIFTFVRSGGKRVAQLSKASGNLPICVGITVGTICQVTQTPRGPIFDPIYNRNPSISGNGSRVVFVSTGDGPIIGTTPGENPPTSRNEEVFIANLTGGAPSSGHRQITVTTSTNPGDPVNILDFGKRISRDGRYVAFDSFADLAAVSPAPNLTSFATYVYDYDRVPTDMVNRFTRILPRSDADADAPGGDIVRYPSFTDYDVNGTPASVVLETRLNINSLGEMPANADGGLNNVEGRPTQIYAFDLSRLNTPSQAGSFERLTQFPLSTFFLASTQPLASDSSRRMVFNLSLTELGTGNPDNRMEAFYLYQPNVVQNTVASINFATGASRMPVSPTAVPTPSPTPSPSPTATPSPTPTPTPSPTPTGTPTPTPSPTPSPTPQTPPAVLGISPGMIAILDFSAALEFPIPARTGVGSLERSFQLPIELGGVTVTINGAACGLKSISRRQIVFQVPRGLLSEVTGTEYPIVVNNNGIVFRGKVTIIPARPDLYSTNEVPGPNGRAIAFNVTNRVHTTEPFTAHTILIRGGRRVSTVLRVRMTGIQDVPASAITLRIGGFIVFGNRIIGEPVEVEPGVFILDFELPPLIDGAGDVPIIIEVGGGGSVFQSRLDDTAVKVNIL